MCIFEAVVIVPEYLKKGNQVYKVFKFFAFVLFASNIIFLQGLIVENKTQQTLKVVPYEFVLYPNSLNFWKKAVLVRIISLCGKPPVQLLESTSYDPIILEPGHYVEFDPVFSMGNYLNVLLVFESDSKEREDQTRSEWDELVSVKATLTVESSKIINIKGH